MAYVYPITIKAATKDPMSTLFTVVLSDGRTAAVDIKSCFAKADRWLLRNKVVYPAWRLRHGGIGWYDGTDVTPEQLVRLVATAASKAPR